MFAEMLSLMGGVIHRRSAEEWKNRFYIVFEGEVLSFCTFGVIFGFSVGDDGQDAGGLLREWYVIVSREIFNPNYALFKSSPGDRVTFTINNFSQSQINSNHLRDLQRVGFPQILYGDPGVRGHRGQGLDS